LLFFFGLYALLTFFLLDIEPSTILRRQPTSAAGIYPKNVLGMEESAQNNQTSTHNAAPMSTQPSQNQGLNNHLMHIVILTYLAEEGLYPISLYITLNPSLPIFNVHPSMKRIVHIAIDRAIREVILTR
jgi:hypothetical protein